MYDVEKVEIFNRTRTFLGVFGWQCVPVFTVTSWGVRSPHVLSELKGAICDTAWKEHGDRQKRRSPCSRKDKEDRDKRLKPHNHLTNYNGPAPVTSRIRGIGERLSQPRPQVSARAINSTLLSTQLISLSGSGSKLHRLEEDSFKNRD